MGVKNKSKLFYLLLATCYSKGEWWLFSSLRMGMSFGPQLWSRQEYLNNNGMDYH